MIKKSLLTAIILLAIFESVIRVSDIKWDTSQNDKSANLISAQNFIYNFSVDQVQNDTVIVGSSMSRKLIPEVLGKNYINLAFNAWCSYDGLQIIKLTKKKPACLLVEANIFGGPGLETDIKNFFDPVPFYSNTFVKSFQLQYQPVGLLVGCIKGMLKKKMEELRRKKRENLDLYKYNIQQKKVELMREIPDSLFEKSFKATKDLINYFRSQNISVIFFEIPVDEDLKNTKKILDTRKYYQRYFPDNEYRYIPLPPINEYVYSDGIHLSLQSASAYTLYLKNELNAGKPDLKR